MLQGRKLLAAAVAVASLGAAGTFAAPAGATGKTLSVTPSSGLHGGDAVHVKGTGFTAGAPVGVTVCASPVVDPSSCDLNNVAEAFADGHGAFTLTYTVHRRIVVLTQTGDAIVDCAVSACVMLAAGQSFDDNATKPLHFSKTGGPQPVITGAPTTKLRDLQRIEVDGHGFGNGITVIGECLSSNLLGACVDLVQVSDNAPGAFASSIPVRRLIPSAPGKWVDCAKAKGTCVLIGVEPQDLDYLTTAPLSFDNSVPPPPLPNATVQPNSKLPYFARVRVRGAHWTPGDDYAVAQCGSATSCVVFPDVISRIDSDGGFDTTLLVSRQYVDPSGFTPTVDCVKQPQCVVVVVDLDEGAAVFEPIHFDPNAPVPPPAKITLAPKGPYHDGQAITVTGHHFAPLASYSVSQCVTTPTSSGCLVDDNNQTTDGNGNLTTPFAVARAIPGLFDCSAKATFCTIDVASEGGRQAEAPLTFVKGGAAAPALTPSALHAHATGFAAPTNPLAWAQSAACGETARGESWVRIAPSTPITSFADSGCGTHK